MIAHRWPPLRRVMRTFTPCLTIDDLNNSRTVQSYPNGIELGFVMDFDGKQCAAALICFVKVAFQRCRVFSAKKEFEKVSSSLLLEVFPVVTRSESGRPSGAKTSSIKAPAPGMARSPCSTKSTVHPRIASEVL